MASIRERLAAKRSVEKSGFRWRAGDVTRLEQFSDAVFAFALALLVVANEIPKQGGELLATLAQFPAFVATFATFVWIWYYHYLYFRRYGFLDAFTTFLNATLLLLILFFVFPLRFIMGALLDGFMGRGWAFTFAQGRTLMIVYSLGFAAVFAMFALLYRHALHLRTELELDELETVITRSSMTANLLLMGLGLVSASVAWIGPWWSTPAAGMIYGMTGPLMWWHARRTARATATVRQRVAVVEQTPEAA
ncbi:MAG TPA: TMEM175 family protein [Gemmatimonadaceae bacterium]|nr:TMEM175 family protein [Gemmatimonadaceae bacterium]